MSGLKCTNLIVESHNEPFFQILTSVSNGGCSHKCDNAARLIVLPSSKSYCIYIEKCPSWIPVVDRRTIFRTACSVSTIAQ